MIYLSGKDIDCLGIKWGQLTNVITDAINCHREHAFIQPKKLYLRFNDLRNRIIAMPSYIGREFNVAGIKWIASFPGNIRLGRERASSVVILNDANSGNAICIINTSLLSVIRTVAVTATILSSYIDTRSRAPLTVGIIGLGPIGRYHIKMLQCLYSTKIAKIIVYDINRQLVDFAEREFMVEGATSWQQAYEYSDVVVTCTCSPDRYINLPPKPGSLLMNVSLRDFCSVVFPAVAETIVVDDWEEVCREDTDIERFSKERGLTKEQTTTITEVVMNDHLRRFPSESPIMVNPMGMAIFDIAIAKHYMDLAHNQGVGLVLD